MEIIKNVNGEELTIFLSGRLTTDNAPMLEAAIKESIGSITSLVFDLSELIYTTSAGLRVFLASHKLLSGNMKLRYVNKEISEIFELTGMINIFNIE